MKRLFFCYGCGCLCCVTVVLFRHVCVRVCTYLSENSPFADWSGGEAVTGAALGSTKQRGYSAGGIALCRRKEINGPKNKVQSISLVLGVPRGLRGVLGALGASWEGLLKIESLLLGARVAL